MDFQGSQNLQDAIITEMRTEGASETASLFKAALEEGLFAIFLDGYDEINPDVADKATKLISKFSRTFGECSIIISTRPGTSAHHLSDFSVFYLNPLNIEQAIELVEKTKFDAASKARFSQALKSGLYKKHPTMMSIPILIVMMLFTFRSYADIPDRMTIFYSQAFDTLYSIHDAEGKESYKRVHHCGLPPDIFRRVLNAFCYLSLSKYEIEFSQSSLRTFVISAIRVARAECNADDFISDLVKNVCILQPEGVNFIFVHRSFQEYFAACFTANFSGNKVYSVYDRILMVAGPEFAKMLAELDKSKLMRIWVTQKLGQFLQELEKLKERPAYEIVNYFFEQIWIDNGTVFATAQRRRAEPMRTSSIFGSIVDRGLPVTHMLRQIRLSDQDLQTLADIDLRNLDARSENPTLRIIPANPSRRGVRLDATKENEKIFERSNAKNILGGYIMTVRNALSDVERYIDEDRLIEDDLLT